MDASVNRIKSSADERAILIALKTGSSQLGQIQYSLDELKLLVSTAGAMIIETMIIKIDKINPGFILGSGNVERIKEIIQDKKIALIVFDLNQIRAVQVRNLEETLKCRVIGRTEIILDIFARRARSSESHIQVELAQLRYILPRLKGLGGVLSRTGAGIGTRGPGEKMLETDRRHILKRISRLDQKLKKISRRRELERKSRSSQILGAVVGYTNAGKSTLINNLAKDDLFVEDRLFATLDSYTRIVWLNIDKKILLTDTVGFIRNLPANLIESFKSTLEDIQNADFIIHVIDITSADIQNNIDVVNNELSSLQCTNKPAILFFNKSDLLKNTDMFAERYHNAIIGSAVDNTGIINLKQKLEDIYDKIKIKAFSSPENDKNGSSDNALLFE